MPSLPIPAGDSCFRSFNFLPHDFFNLVETPDFLI